MRSAAGKPSEPIELGLGTLQEIARLTAQDLELRALLQSVAERLRADFGFDVVACATVDLARRGLTYEAVAAGAPVALRVGERVAFAVGAAPVLAGAQSRLRIPLGRSEEALGWLHLESHEAGALEAQRHLLGIVADQLAGAIASARRYEELRQHAALAELTSQVSRVALEATGLEQLLQRVVDYIAERLSVAIASILLLDQSGTKFIVEAFSGSLDMPLAQGGEWPITVGVCGRCVRSGEAQLVEDVRADPDYVAGNAAVESEYIVPLRASGRILGVLNLESTRADTFTPYVRQVFDNLAAQIAGAVHLANVNRQLEQANQELERLSTLDGLTGIANRRHFDLALRREWRRAARDRSPLTVMVADLDHFKPLNDAHGHPHGDRCLKQVAEALRSALRRSGDTLARYGGEEFALILPGTGAAEALAHAEALRAAVAALRLPHGGVADHPWVTISVGVATGRADELDAEALVRLADAALYGAKRAGRDRCVALRPGEG
jgi:diguanylate cyclase (GGDEF)-like protein